MLSARRWSQSRNRPSPRPARIAAVACSASAGGLTGTRPPQLGMQPHRLRRGRARNHAAGQARCPGQRAGQGPARAYASQSDDPAPGIQSTRRTAACRARPCELAFRAPSAPLDASAARPPAATARRHRFAGIRDTRNQRATSRSLAPASISSAAANRTCSRRARSAASSPPPSGYLMPMRYRRARQPSAGLVTSAVKDL